MTHPLAPTVPAQPEPALQPFGLLQLDTLNELRALVHRAQQRMQLPPGTELPHGYMEDQRTAVVADLLDTLDRIEPGLGTRLQHAMYPRSRPAFGAERRRS